MGSKKYNAGFLSVGVGLVSDSLQRDIDKALKPFIKLERSLKDVGKSLTKNISLPLAGLGTVAAKTAIDFQSAFAGVKKTVNATGPELKKLEKGILDMSKRLPKSAVEISKVAENAGQLGIQSKNILGFTETLIRLSDATNVAADEGAILLAQYANVTKLPQDKFKELGAAIVDLGNNSATTEKDIVELMQRIGAAGHLIGLSQGEMIGLSAAIASTGMEAQAGGTAISKTFREMYTWTKTNADQLQVLNGVIKGDFKEAFEKNAGDALRRFIEGLGNLKNENKNVVEVLNDLHIKESRQVDTLLRLANSGDLLTKSLERGNKAFADGSALLIESDKRYETLASQLQITLNNITALGIELGTVLMPYIRQLSDYVRDLTVEFSKLDIETKENIVLFGSLAAVLGPTIIATSFFVTAVKNIYGAALIAIAGVKMIIPFVSVVFAKAMAAGAVAVGWLSVALNALIAHPIVAGIAALTVGVVIFAEEIRDALKGVDDYVDTVKTRMPETSSAVTKVNEDIRKSIEGSLLGPMVKAIDEIIEKILGAFDYLVQFKNKVADFFTPSTPANLDTTAFSGATFGYISPQALGNYKAMTGGAEELTIQLHDLRQESAKTSEGIEGTSTVLGKGTKELKEHEKAAEKAKEALESLQSTLRSNLASDNQSFLEESLQGAIKAKASQKTIDSIKGQIFEGVRDSIVEGHLSAGGVIDERSLKSIDELARYEYQKKVAAANKAIDHQEKETKSSIDRLADRLPDFVAESITDGILNGFEEGFGNGTVTQLMRSASQAFANEFQNSFRDLFKKENFFLKDAAGKLTDSINWDAITGTAANFGLAYGTNALSGVIAKNEKDQKGGALAGAATGASIGTMIMPGWGTLIGGVVGGVGGAVLGSHGKSTNPDTKARHETINFIEDAISSAFLPFLKEQGNIIEGDSRRFNVKGGGGFFGSGFGRGLYDAAAIYATGGLSLAAGAYTGEASAADRHMGGEYFATPGQIQGPGWADQFFGAYGMEGGQTFQALGAAMLQFAGEAQDTAGQVGVILAENLVGNLDNARMLLQTMGIGAQELEDAFLKIGLSGEQSWHTVETYFQSIQDLTGEGLSGVGDLQGAFMQLKDSAGRGQSALIALQNLSIEASEKGITSLAALKNEMLSSGDYSADEINILFQALDQRGIGTLEGLKDASQRLLGGVVADLESLGFGWGKFDEILNQSALSLNQLQEELDKLNNRKIAVDIELNYVENNRPNSDIIDSAIASTTPTLNSSTVNYNVDARGSSPGVGREVARALQAAEDQAVSRSLLAVGGY